MDQREVLGLEVVHVSEHVCLVLVVVEDWLGEELGGPAEAVWDGTGRQLLFSEHLGIVAQLLGELRDRSVGVGRSSASAAPATGALLAYAEEDVEEVDDVFKRRAFVKCDTDVVAVDPAQVDSLTERFFVHDLAGRTVQADGEGVKELLVDDLVALTFERYGDQRGEGMHFVGNLLETVWTVINGVLCRGAACMSQRPAW